MTKSLFACLNASIIANKLICSQACNIAGLHKRPVWLMSMARKMTVAMKKGGSGKTTTTVNLAAALVLRGKRVLFVDLDLQANATIALGINPLELATP
jgi:Mrp family chromosome partitioning ATPase